jgi:hypothetical protein
MFLGMDVLLLEAWVSGVFAPDSSTAVGYSADMETMAAFRLCLATQVVRE